MNGGFLPPDRVRLELAYLRKQEVYEKVPLKSVFEMPTGEAQYPLKSPFLWCAKEAHTHRVARGGLNSWNGRSTNQVDVRHTAVGQSGIHQGKVEWFSSIISHSPILRNRPY